MPIGTQDPSIYPATQGPITSTGAKYAGMEARGDKLLNMHLIQHEDDFTLVAPAPAVGDVDIEVDATHTIAIGDYVEVHEDDVYFQALVLNVVGDTITLDTAVPYAFTVAGAAGINGTPNAAVNGSATPVVYELSPPAGQIWDITKLMFYLEDATVAMTHSLFGNLTALANGVSLRVMRSADKYEQIANFKINADFSLNSFETKVSADMTSGDFGMYSSKTFGNEGESGSVIRLNGDANESLQVVINDDISALDLFELMAFGYFLDDQ
jgi:hypothetical protein